MDWNAINLTRLYKERKESDRRRRKTGGKQNPRSVVSELYPERFELEISLSWLPGCRHPYNHFAVLWRQNRTESVCAQPLFVIPACETKIWTKNSNISHLRLVAIAWGMWMGPYFQRCWCRKMELKKDIYSKKIEAVGRCIEWVFSFHIFSPLI